MDPHPLSAQVNPNFKIRAGWLHAGSLILALFRTNPATAQAVAPEQKAAAPAAIQAPRLLQQAEATYPLDAKLERLEATVRLRLTIDVNGHVEHAEIIEAVGHGFDEAARQAALDSRFHPAMQDGIPKPSKILYAYEFHLPAEEQPTERASSDFQKSGVIAASEVGTPHPVDSDLLAKEDQTKPLEVVVTGTKSEADELQQSAEAVNVVSLHKAQEQTADLGEVLARTQGIAVRRNGGLGSEARFSLNGFSGEQIRFFLDGVPLTQAGYPFGVVNVPVNLVERVEVYRGVVPIRFGGDALGGAVNLVSDQSYETQASASYQVGSFGTHRVTAHGGYRHEPSSFVIRGSGFFDTALNNYDVDVNIPDEQGRPQPSTVPRFHDAYKAFGTSLEAGIVDRPYAERLLLRAFVSGYDKALQHNVFMTLPYGEVEYGETVYGTTARYEAEIHPAWHLSLVGSFTHRVIDFHDASSWVYNWAGERVRERRFQGEIGPEPYDQRSWENTGFGRLLLGWKVAAQHELRASTTPQYSTRTGRDQFKEDEGVRDPLSAQRDLFSLVSGVEYEVNLLDERLSNILLLKQYVYRASSEEPLPGDILKLRDASEHRFGIGDSFRFRFTDWILAKASYEYATRLPQANEMFGDAILVHANLDLKPETSHNVNLGPRVELDGTAAGDFLLDINMFARKSDQMIILLGTDRFYTYQNVYAARGVGIENAAEWTSPGRLLTLDGTFTWQDIRNTSSEGTFGDVEGDRIPNRPYLFGSWGARIRFSGMPTAQDRIEPFYSGRAVGEFLRGWESQGARQYKLQVDTQVSHSLGITWLVNREAVQLANTLEVDNLTNADLYDNFGVQRPGRAIYLKVSGEIR